MRKFILSIAFFSISPVVFLFVLVISLLLYHEHLLNQPQILGLNTVAFAALPTNQNNFSVSVTESDGRAEKIRQFFAKYNSPLEPYADDVVKAADEYGLDYRLVPAIAMQESNLCRVIPPGSYNCWGFGIYGHTVTRFNDYKEAIYTVTKTLANNYKGNGLITPDEIQKVYTPSSNGSWAYSVNHFMDVLK